MPQAIRNPADFWTGLIYLAFGVVALWIGQEYTMGSAGRMGPGYLPRVLGVLLLLFGAIALIRSFISPGPPLGAIPWKALVLVLLASWLFAFLIHRAGLVIAMIVLVLVSAAASSRFRFEWGATAGLVVLVAFCALVFVKGLGVPMPLLGSWFGG